MIGNEPGRELDNFSEEKFLPSGYSISANYPNPFNPTTTIDFQLPENSHVKIKVFNLRGEIVATLIDRQMNAGSYSAKWDGLHSSDTPLPSGVYIYSIVAGDFSQTRKMILLK